VFKKTKNYRCAYASPRIKPYVTGSDKLGQKKKKKKKNSESKNTTSAFRRKRTKGYIGRGRSPGGGAGMFSHDSSVGGFGGKGERRMAAHQNTASPERKREGKSKKKTRKPHRQVCLINARNTV